MTRAWLIGVALLVCWGHAAAQGAAADAAAGDAPAPEDAVRFDVWEFQVTGVRLIDAREIERAVYPFLGPSRRVADVEGAARAVEALYEAQGYGATTYVNIPEQDVERGVVRLDVSEGAVERLRVTGSRYFDIERIREKLPSVAPGEVPHLPSMQRELAALNAATANRRITPVLKPARSQGMVDIDIEVEDEFPVHGGLAFTNQYVRDTTETRLSGDVRYENLWQREHSVGFSFQLTPEDPNEVRVFSGTYLLRPEGSDWLIAAYGVNSDSDVTTFSGDSAGGGIGVLGKGFVIGARAIRPLPMRGPLIHNFTLGADYKDFNDEISVPGAAERIFNPISFVKFIVGWGGFVPFERADLKFNIDTHFSARGMGNSEIVDVSGIELSEFANKRAFARPNFFFVRTDLDGSFQSVFDSTLRLRFDGQLASVALVSNEQFSLGGVDTVRGYFEAQALADNAAAISVEWRSPSLHRFVWGDVFRDVRLLAFSDAARGMLIDPLPDSDAGFGLASIGLGLSAAGHGFGSELIWAWPMIDAAGVDAYDPRFHFQMSYDF